MPQTGNLFTDTFTEVCIFLPLLPVIIIFFKKIYHNEALNFLMILCLLNFIKGILLLIPGLIIISQVIINNIFALPELIILAFIFRVLFSGKIKNILTVFFVAFLSSVITYYLLNGINQKREAMELVQELVILGISISGLLELIGNNDIHVFKLPLSWIAIGTIFYFSISILVTILNTPEPEFNRHINGDTQIILDIAGFARYLFYMLAGWFYQPSDYNKEENRKMH
jgi:hypothetical protein